MAIRRYAIDCKGQGRKEVIYLRVANVSCTRGVRESTGLLLWRPLRCGSVTIEKDTKVEETTIADIITTTHPIRSNTISIINLNTS